MLPLNHAAALEHIVNPAKHYRVTTKLPMDVLGYLEHVSDQFAKDEPKAKRMHRTRYAHRDLRRGKTTARLM